MIQLAVVNLVYRLIGASGRRDRITCGLGRLIRVGELQRSPGLARVPLDAIGQGDAPCDRDHAVAEVNAIDHHDGPVVLTQGGRQPLRQLLLAQSKEAPRGATLGCRQRCFRWRQRLQRVVAASHFRGPGTTIGAFCDSAACLAFFK
jgi:hypothetical protein